MRKSLASTLLLMFAAAVLLSHAPATWPQSVKSSIASTDLKPTGSTRWLKDLAYNKRQVYPLTFETTGCPAVEVEISGTKLSLMLDSGTARGFVITNHAPAVPHRVTGKAEEFNADGSNRGESEQIVIERMSILGVPFENISGTLSDWRMFSSEPLDGTIGLDFFLDRRLTLNYRSRQIAVSAAPLPRKLDSRRYISLDLVTPPRQGHILYARARVNGRDALVYLDTGYNVSFIDPKFTDGLPRVDRPRNRFTVFREQVPVVLGGHKFVLNELREDSIRRGPGFELPVILVLGSDVLSYLIVTVDLRAGKLVLGMAK